jgi:Putative transmembrane protein (PGPGW)
LFMAAGFVLLFIPGPGLVFLFVGAFLIAQQSLLAARALDWSELRLKKLLAWSLGGGGASRQP